jgi:hypothetical protein
MNRIWWERVAVCCLAGLFLGIAGGLLSAPTWVLIVTATAIGASVI